MKKRILGLIIGFLFIGINGFAADGDLIVNGKVGIGTTQPATKLHVYGDAGNGLAVGSSAAGGIQIWPDPNVWGPAILFPSGGALRFGTQTAWNAAGWQELIRINASGNVGIGTVSPTDKLEVRGGGIRTSIGTSGASDGVLYFGSDATNFVYGGNQNNIMAFGTNGSERVRIDNYGNVGIGTATPGSYKLYVAGEAYSTGGWQSSDLRFKENIRAIESPLNKILNMEGISFDWKKDEFKDKGFPEGRHYGVVAQEVERVLPEVVKEGPGGEKSVSYTEIVPVLIEAIKEQQKEIERLKLEVTQIKARN